MKNPNPSLFPAFRYLVLRKNNKMTIIALDIATKMGFCTPDCSGVYDFSKCNKYEELYHFLWELNAAYSPDIFAVERTAGTHKNALIMMSRMRGVVDLFAEKNGIAVIDFSANTIKKDFTGSGGASKQDMVNRFHLVTGRYPIDDNEADAYALYQLAMKKK